MNKLLVLSLFAALFCAPTLAQTAGPDFADVDRELALLAGYIGGYPPRFDAVITQEAAPRRLAKVIETLKGLDRAKPGSAEVLWRLGDAYRLGHNIDLDGAWEESERDCRAAIAADEHCFKAYETLGLLYVATDPKMGPDAKKLFDTAIALAGTTPLPMSHFGLVFVHVYERDLDAALREADVVLRLQPDRDDVRRLRDELAKKPKIKEETRDGSGAKPHD